MITTKAGTCFSGHSVADVVITLFSKSESVATPLRNLSTSSLTASASTKGQIQTVGFCPKSNRR